MPPMGPAESEAVVVAAGVRAEIASEGPLRNALRRVASRQPCGGKVVINMEMGLIERPK